MATPSLDADTKMTYARLVVARKTPYFASAVLSLAYREVPRGTLGTIGVTARAICLWDRAFVDTLTVDETAAVLVHEVQHLLRDHHARCAAGGFDHARFNRAGDRAINGDLVAAGYSLPGKPCLPGDVQLNGQPAPAGLTAEEYYACESTDPAAGGGGCTGTGCGSGAGNALPGEPPDGDPVARSPEEIAAMARRTAEEIRAHVAQNGRGAVPAGFGRWAEETLKPPRVPWQQRLAVLTRTAIAMRAGAVDRTWSRINRKQAGIGFGVGRPLVPGTYAPVPNVALAIDTSGSMGHAELYRAASEGAAILNAVGAAVEFCACDADVQGEGRIRSVKELTDRLKGGGGTDFRPVFERLATKRPRPDVIIFITDGDGPAPRQAPVGSRVIWVLVGPYARKPSAVDQNSQGEWESHGDVAYGDFVVIDDDHRAQAGAAV